jgi:hypothetical protein
MFFGKDKGITCPHDQDKTPLSAGDFFLRALYSRIEKILPVQPLGLSQAERFGSDIVRPGADSPLTRHVVGAQIGGI